MFPHSYKNYKIPSNTVYSTVFLHAIQQLQVILHTELILLQESSKKYYNYKAHPVQAPSSNCSPCLQAFYTAPTRLQLQGSSRAGSFNLSSSTVVFPHSYKNYKIPSNTVYSTVFLHVIQQLQVILHTELILLQESSKKYYNYKAHPVQAPSSNCSPCLQAFYTAPTRLQLQGSSRAGSFQQLFPVSPSILHGRIRLPASLQHSKAIQHKQASSNSTRQKQHSTRQPASTQSLQ